MADAAELRQEFNAIAGAIAALEGLSLSAKGRVLQYIASTVEEEVRSAWDVPDAPPPTETDEVEA